MRIARSIAVVVAVLAGSLPLGGCIGFMLGYGWGSGAGHLQGLHDARRYEDVERWVCAATMAEAPRDRLRALETMRRAYRSPDRYDPADVRRQADGRLARIAETLDDADPAVAAAGRRLLRDMVGETVDLSHEDRRLLIEAMTPQAAGPDDWKRSGEIEAAYERACTAALRAYGLARLGEDLHGAVPLLRRGLAFRVVTVSGERLALSVYCALALHAVTEETDATLPVFAAGLPQREQVIPHRAVYGGLLGPSETIQVDDMQPAIAAVIGLGRLGAAAGPARGALRQTEGRADLPLRNAAAHARSRIEASSFSSPAGARGCGD